ncbi:MAG: MurR/RpiR family transcriptional regulator [Hyphomicrobiaceae bacterium]
MRSRPHKAPSQANLLAHPAAVRHGPPRSIRERLLDGGLDLSKAEVKVARELLANYPAAGLSTISRLADLAGVSDPTVLRFAGRLGFGGFGEMQESLLAEVEAHMRSPLTMAAAKLRERRPANVYEGFFASLQSQLEAARNETPPEDLDAAVALLADPRARILCLGGRFSRYLAGVLHRCLQHLRPGTELIDGTAADLIDRLADIGPRDVLVVYDYRRYQADVVRFAEQSAGRGARLVLFTDRWKSPLARHARVTLTVPTETTSPFDTMVTPLAQTEAVVAGLTAALGSSWRERAEVIERVRTANRITVDGAERSLGRLRKTRKTSRRKP